MASRFGAAGFAFRLQIYGFILLWTLLTCVKLFFEFVRHPLAFFQSPKRRLTPPQCMLDESLGKHEYVRANGIKFHCVTSGDKSKPLMLFLHGFPEFWYSWRHQIREFSSDYHVVAIDLRGYNETDSPPNTLDYTLSNLRQDIVELIPALGHSNATLVAHDWGGVIAWTVAHRHPELVEKLIVLNVPHARVFKKTILGTWAQKMKSWYMFLFQIPRLPEFIIAQNDYRYFNAIFRGRKAGVRNRDGFSPEDVDAYKYVFSQPGALTGPINYIRCVFTMFGSQEDKALSKTKVKVPTLILWGDDDLFLESSMADAHGDLVADLTVKHIPKCSHWAQQDQHEVVNQYIKEFI